MGELVDSKKYTLNKYIGIALILLYLVWAAFYIYSLISYQFNINYPDKSSYWLFAMNITAGFIGVSFGVFLFKEKIPLYTALVCNILIMAFCIYVNAKTIIH